MQIIEKRSRLRVPRALFVSLALVFWCTNRAGADTYAGYTYSSPGRFPSTNWLERPYEVRFTSNRDGVEDFFCLSFPKDFDPGKTYPVWFKFKPFYGSGSNIKQANFAYNLSDARQVIYIGCNERGVGDSSFGDNTNLPPATAQGIPADMLELLSQLCYLLKINYVASFGGSMGGYSALRFMVYLPSNYVGAVTPSCPALWFRDYIQDGSEVINAAVKDGHFNDKFVLIMHGMEDDTVPISISETLTASAPQTNWWQLVRAPSAGHEEFFCIFHPTLEYPFDEEWGKSTLVPNIWDQIKAWETAHPGLVNRRLPPLPGWQRPTNWYLPKAVVAPGAPVADAGADQIVIDAATNGWEWVTLNGAGSSGAFHPASLLTNYLWMCHGQPLATGTVVLVQLPTGTNLVTLEVRDNLGGTDRDTVEVRVLTPSFSRIQRTIPPLPTILAASTFLTNGDIPEDHFLPPANAVYVATADRGGNDTNPGTSLAAPFEHLDTAIDYANTHADTPLTIYLRGGVHYYKTLMPDQEIARGNLYLTAYGAEPVIIRPYSWPNNPTDMFSELALVCVGAYSNVTFANLTFEGWGRIFLLGSWYEIPALRNVTIKDVQARRFRYRDGDPSNFRTFLETAILTNDIYGEGKVIFDQPQTAHYQIENLLISNVWVVDVDLGINIGDENDANVKGLRISSLEVRNSPRRFTDSNGTDAIGIVNSFKILIDNCTLENIENDGIDTKSYDVSVVNCLVQSTVRNGVKLWRNGEMINTIIRDATWINDGALVVQDGGPFRMVHCAMLLKTNGYAGTLYGTNQGGLLRLQFINSVFSDLAHSFYIEPDAFGSRNCLYDQMPGGLFTGFADLETVADLNAWANCSGNISAPPALVDAARADFSPRAGSACIDAGADTGVLLPAFDFYGRPRINGTKPDIGPVEYDAAFVDTDGDRYTDAEESITGTSPLDPNDYFHLVIRSIEPGGRSYVVYWPSVVNRRYDLLTSTNALSNWQAVPGWTNLAGTGVTLAYTNSFDTIPRFYRAKVWRP